MVRTEFKVKPHLTRGGVEIVEVWIDGKFTATITPSDIQGVRIISKHIAEVSQTPQVVSVEFKGMK